MTTLKILLLGGDDFVAPRVFAELERAAWASPEAVDSAGLDAARLTSCDVVINCTLGSPEAIESVARRLFTAAAAAERAPRIVHLSSMTVYGTATGVVDESAPMLADLGAYSTAQLAAEQCAAAYSRSVILRPGCEYGPGSKAWSLRIARWLKAGRIGTLGNDGHGRCNLLHIDDLVAAILASARLDGAEGQCFNLATPAPPTWNEYFQEFGKVLGLESIGAMSAARRFVETRLLAIPLKLTEVIATRLLGSAPRWLPPAIPPSLIPLCGQDIQLDVRKAERILGMKWTALDAGLRNTAESLRLQNQ